MFQDPQTSFELLLCHIDVRAKDKLCLIILSVLKPSPIGLYLLEDVITQDTSPYEDNPVEHI